MCEVSLIGLKRFLFDLPSQLNFSFTEDVKYRLRKELFRAFTIDGKYLNLIFPQLFEQGKDTYRELDEVIQWLLFKYVAHIARILPPNGEANHHAFHTDLPCARVFRRGEPIYKCLTCGFNDTCALCANCFRPESHEGHNVNVSICVRENGGVCDCGDPEAWVKDFLCVYHETNDSFEKLKHMTPSTDLQQTLLDTVGILLDFIVDVMCQSDQQFASPHEVISNYDRLTANCELSPERYGYPHTSHSDPPSEKFALIAYNDQIRHFRDAVQRIHLASKKVPEFAEMVAKRIQDHGRATVIRSKDPNLLFERQRLLSATGLSSCIRNSRDEFREEMCFEIVLWLESISSCDLLKANEPLRNLFCRAFCMRWNRGLVSNTSIATQQGNIAHLNSNFDIPSIEEMGDPWNTVLKPWKHLESLYDECNYCSVSISQGNHFGSRLQYLSYLDIRYWKAFRLALHTMYATTLITNLKWKGMVCYQYCDIYPFLSDMFLNLDGDPEINVMCTLSCQLFVSPSNSNAILMQGGAERIFGTAILFLKYGHTHSTRLAPDNDLSLASLKNRRWGQLFFDIGYILSRGQNSDVLRTDSMIPMTCHILSLFQGKPTLRREVESHVEYESSDYAAFFHAIPVIYQLADYVSQCLKNTDDLNRRQQVFSDSISYVVQHIIKLEGTVSGSKAHNEVDYGQLNFEENDPGNLGYSGRAVSFLHPLHLFLSWLIEYAAYTDKALLLDIFAKASKDACNDSSKESWETSVKILFHYPIQSIVLAAQVKTGFWVRNGFSVKNQLQLYKSTGLREQGYLRDIFLAQIYLICNDVDKAVRNILGIWLLNDEYLPDKKCPYDMSMLPYILDECLSFFLHVLTEGLFSRHLGANEITKAKIEDEIIHQLCLGSMNYSKLCSQIPDHIVSERSFDSILETVAQFKEPRSGNETGTFVLKEVFYERVNPYYHNYTLNKKDEAIKLIKERIRRRTNRPIEEVFIQPSVELRKGVGIYQTLANFTASFHFVSFLATCLRYVLSEGPQKFDSLLDTLLHVIHTSALEVNVTVEPSESFCNKSTRLLPNVHYSLAGLLYKALLHDEIKEHHSKVRAIIQSFSEHVEQFFAVMEASVEHFDPKLLSTPNESHTENEAERRKRLAFQRQNRLMAKFKKQQSLFLRQNDIASDFSDDEMEDIEEEGWKFPDSHCILCQDTAKDAGPLGVIVHISRSSEFRDVPFEDDYWFLKAFSDNLNLNETDDNSFPEAKSARYQEYMERTEGEFVVGPGFDNQAHVSSRLVSLTCGHGMHFNCYVQFLSSNRSRSNHITRNTPDNIEHREFLCPLCKALNNMFVPILWAANNRSMKKLLLPGSSECDHFESLLKNNLQNKFWLENFCKAASDDLQEFSILTNSAKEIIGQDAESLESPGQQQFRILLSNMFQILSLLTFPEIFKADSSNILVNTIKSLEMSLRGTSSSSGLLIEQISNSALINLRALNEFRITSLIMKTSNWIKNSAKKPDTHVKILANVLTLSAERFNQTIIYHDFLEILVNVLPVPSAGFSFHEILKSCFIGRVIQTFHILVTEFRDRDFFRRESYDILDVPFSDLIAYEDSVSTIQVLNSMFATGLYGEKNDQILCERRLGLVVFSMLLKSVTPFLRQAAIFAFVNCHSDSEVSGLFENSVFEADRLCNLLNLPTLSVSIKRMCGESFMSTLEAKRFTSFLAFVQQKSSLYIEDPDSRVKLEYPGRILLIRLPKRLDDFFTRYYYLERYDFPHLSIENPAVCMFCGKVCDLQRAAIGSRYGQCSTHYTKQCQSSVGIFLLPKDRSILLLSKNGGSFHAIPYIDLHFEVAGDNKKTKAVFLLQKRYDEFIRLFWLQHDIPNYIVRNLDSVIDAGGWETL